MLFYEYRMMRRLLDQHVHVLDHGVSPALFHMDVWGQNILVDDEGHMTALLDWNRALWGDPEIVSVQRSQRSQS